MMRSLEETLKYDHIGTRSRLESKFGISSRESKLIFQELKKWLWLNARHDVVLANSKPSNPIEGIPSSLSIRTEQLVIDEAWHLFLQYTEDYKCFCEDFLGRFIGHAPNDSDHVLEDEAIEKNLKEYLTFVFDELGAITLQTWFVDFPSEYSEIRLLELQIQQIKLHIESLKEEA